ncbi:hypothetical protein GCM10010841_21740 [Deinococcus aerophilus]|uniref:Uncharacterized protein n=1 Tax=Deinococcus aerophilus TaxID=522488 RepID=A0ABQ2GUM3_9DEIO|nr:hypothetical protein GCM10010841_21740 [Deinococcus aerophilus]
MGDQPAPSASCKAMFRTRSTREPSLSAYIMAHRPSEAAKTPVRLLKASGLRSNGVRGPNRVMLPCGELCNTKPASVSHRKNSQRGIAGGSRDTSRACHAAAYAAPSLALRASFGASSIHGRMDQDTGAGTNPSG